MTSTEDLDRHSYYQSIDRCPETFSMLGPGPAQSHRKLRSIDPGAENDRSWTGTEILQHWLSFDDRMSMRKIEQQSSNNNLDIPPFFRILYSGTSFQAG